MHIIIFAYCYYPVQDYNEPKGFERANIISTVYRLCLCRHPGRSYRRLNVARCGLSSAPTASLHSGSPNFHGLIHPLTPSPHPHPTAPHPQPKPPSVLELVLWKLLRLLCNNVLLKYVNSSKLSLKEDCVLISSMRISS